MGGASRFLETMQDYLTFQEVARQFGLRMRGCQKMGRSWVIETDEGPKEVNRLRHTLEDYRFTCTAVDYLRGQGFSRLPRAGWAPSGKPAVDVAGVSYTIHDWTSGDKADLRHIHQLTQAVEMMAWLHRCSQGFSPLESPAGRRNWGSWPQRFLTVLEDLHRFAEIATAVKQEDRFARYYLKSYGDFLNEAARAREELEKTPYEMLVGTERERGGLCHGDYCGESLILRDDGALVLTGFDRICLDSRLEDLGGFIAAESYWDPERTLFILQVYHGVNPLSRDDVNCLQAYLRVPFDFWTSAGEHFAGRTSDRRTLKRLAADLPQRVHLLAMLREARLTFLDGAGLFPNPGMAEIAGALPGKAWATATPPRVDGGPTEETEWWWQPDPTGDPLADTMSELQMEYDLVGTVLEEAGIGAGVIWPEPAMAAVTMPELLPVVQSDVEETTDFAPTTSEQATEPATKPESIPDPTPVSTTVASVDSPEVAWAPGPNVMTWRAFPAPLRGQGQPEIVKGGEKW